MFVHIDSVAHHAQMADLFGIPTPTVSDDEEWFGPYELNGAVKFWRYDVVFAQWFVVDAASAPVEVGMGSRVTISEVREADFAISNVGLIPAPRYPERDHSHVDTMWFAYAGWWFGWSIDREAKEWQLLFLGRV